MFFFDQGFHFFVSVIELIKRSGIDKVDPSESGWSVVAIVSPLSGAADSP